MPSHFVYCDEWFDPNSNLFKMFLENGFENRIQEKKRKSKNERVQQVVKFVLGKLNKIFHF